MASSRMSEIPKWWPLPIYAHQFTELEWIGALVFRLAVSAKWHNTKKGNTKETFEALLVDEKRTLSEIGGRFVHDEGLGVRDTSIFEAHLLALVNGGDENSAIVNLATEASKYCLNGATDRLGSFEEIIEFRKKDGDGTPAINAVGQEGFFSVMKSWAPCMVDMRLDDATLIKSFEIWLALA